MVVKVQGDKSRPFSSRDASRGALHKVHFTGSTSWGGKFRGSSQGQTRYHKEWCDKDVAEVLGELSGAICLNKGQKKHINFSNMNFLAPTQITPF